MAPAENRASDAGQLLFSQAGMEEKLSSSMQVVKRYFLSSYLDVSVQATTSIL